MTTEPVPTAPKETAPDVPLAAVGQQISTPESTDSAAPSGITQPASIAPQKTAPKESQRWIDTMRGVKKTLDNNQRVIFIADREADIFDLFVASTQEDLIPLVRAKWNRQVENPENYLFDAVSNATALGEMTIEVPRSDGERSRKAVLRYGLHELP